MGIDIKSREANLELQLFHPDPVLGVHPDNLCGVGKVLKTKEKDDKKNKDDTKTPKVEDDNKNKDELWEACITAVNATRYYRDTTERLLKQDANWKDRRLLIYIPMVATGNKLFFANLSIDTPTVQQVDSAFYVYQGLSEDGEKRSHFIVPIITEASLSRIVNAIINSSIRFLEKFFTWQKATNKGAS